MFGKNKLLAVISAWMCCFMLGESGFGVEYKHCYHEKQPMIPGCGYVLYDCFEKPRDVMGVRWMEVGKDGKDCSVFGAQDAYDVGNFRRYQKFIGPEMEKNPVCHAYKTGASSKKIRERNCPEQ